MTLRLWRQGSDVGSLLSFLVLAALFAPIAECPGLDRPVSGDVARPFAPVGRYAGHWGVDFSTQVGSDVRPAAAGVVTFAGSVAEILSVTVDHGGGLRTSYSYLNAIDVVVGQWVDGASILGLSGLDHDLAAVHFSVRVDGVYQDPTRWLGCFGSPHQGLSLVPILRAVRRGILGGTFDPPHLAHLFAGEAAYRDLGLDVVTFIPAGAPWQKAGRRMTSAEDRWRMTELAVVDIPYFEADDREVRREGWTYTVDTLHSYPDDEQLFLILGADAARGVSTWQSAGDVLKRATIAVIPRPGVERNEVDEALEGGEVIWLETPNVRLSGTMLRRQASAGRSIRFLVRDNVCRYVLDNRIYQPETR